MLGKKRYLENIRQSTTSQNNLDINNSYRSHSKKLKTSSEKTPKELLSMLYNMERSLCMSCVKTKNKKFQTNKIIPCIPFSTSS